MNKASTALTLQELALYPSVQIKTPEAVGRIKAIDFEAETITVAYCAMGPDYDKQHHLPTEAVQLLLRPLETMTEAEAKELYVAINPGREPFENRAYLDELDSDEEWYRPKLHLWIGEPAAWQYLLSRHFDLFNWIGSKALDKTKECFS